MYLFDIYEYVFTYLKDFFGNTVLFGISMCARACGYTHIYVYFCMYVYAYIHLSIPQKCV